jgi:hypothetical protein
MSKNRFAAVLLAASLAGFISSAAASPILIYDGYALKQACADGTAYYTYGKCAGYIIGVHDQYVLAVGWEVNICVSLEGGNTADGMIDPVADYLGRSDTRLSDPAPTLVIAALKEAFPCRKE